MTMDYVTAIAQYLPQNDQEAQDQKVIMEYIRLFPDTILTRENEFAHITSSGFILNQDLDKALMVHHNIRNSWSWTGGHVDGETDFLQVALCEAREETGVENIYPLSPDIVSLDVLPGPGHRKDGKWVSSHQHLSVAYILIASEEDRLQVKGDENSAVSWFPLEKFIREHFSAGDVYLYRKVIERARLVGKGAVAK